MNAGITSQGHARPIDIWFDHYSGDHVNATNQRIHVVAVPLILWSVIGLAQSPITGPEGNVEFLLAAVKGKIETTN